jgi:hypothetical protein
MEEINNCFKAAWELLMAFKKTLGVYSTQIPGDLAKLILAYAA